MVMQWLVCSYELVEGMQLWRACMFSTQKKHRYVSLVAIIHGLPVFSKFLLFKYFILSDSVFGFYFYFRGIKPYRNEPCHCRGLMIDRQQQQQQQGEQQLNSNKTGRLYKTPQYIRIYVCMYFIRWKIVCLLFRRIKK